MDCICCSLLCALPCASWRIRVNMAQGRQAVDQLQGSVVSTLMATSGPVQPPGNLLSAHQRGLMRCTLNIAYSTLPLLSQTVQHISLNCVQLKTILHFSAQGRERLRIQAWASPGLMRRPKRGGHTKEAPVQSIPPINGKKFEWKWSHNKDRQREIWMEILPKQSEAIFLLKDSQAALWVIFFLQ